MDVFHSPEFDHFLNQKDFRCAKFNLVTRSTILYVTALLIYQTVIWVKLGSRDLNIYSLFFAFFPYHLSYVFTVVLELMYWHLVYAIKIRMDTINHKLAKFTENELSLENEKKISSVDALNAELFKVKQSTLIFRIRNITRGYLHLTAAKNSVNQCYGFIILVVVLGCFLHLLVTPYLLRSIISTASESELFIISQSIWMMGHVLRLFLIVEPCDGCFVQCKNSSLIICNLLCSDLDREVKKSLKLLLLCLSQCELDFTAFGLTRIHRRILTAIAGAVTTYLVILFQFN
ncbi:gustatory receptor for sugar taste 43a-like isoform X3 [Zophobas morio]|uniref:gustatory receptor for sugar taste 43a-like isoform X3 n=1 Tax=Zophobas morio TaxID=2755281 RepID=UPI0030827E5E